MASSIEGLARLNRKLAALPVVVKKRIREAMEQGAAEIVALAKSFCPADSGALRDSIDWTCGKAPKGALTIASLTSTGNELTLTVYAGDGKAYYARFVEFGTAAHTAGGKFEGATIPAVAAQPFFYVSYRANRKKVKSRISRAINKAAREVAAGGG